MDTAMIGKLVSITGLVDAPELNGCRGRVAGLNGCHGRLARYKVIVFHDPPIQCALKNINVLALPTKWIQQTQNTMFDQLGMIRHFKAPRYDSSSDVVPSLDQLQTRSSPPSSAVINAFWGPDVFKFMVERLRKQLYEQRSPGLLWNFHNVPPRCGMVFSDGTKNTQISPNACGDWGMWWPVIFAPETTSTAFVAYCQANALNGSRGWLTDPSRIVALRDATRAILCGLEHPHEIITPGPIIEEIHTDPQPKPEHPHEIITPGPIIEEIHADPQAEPEPVVPNPQPEPEPDTWEIVNGSSGGIWL